MAENNKLNVWLEFLIIVGLGCLIYANTFAVPFLFDDIGYVHGNYALRDIHDIPAIWQALNNPARFIGFYTFALNYHFHGNNVYGYHLVNLLVHLLNALLVWWFTLLLVKRTSAVTVSKTVDIKLLPLFTALIFLTHPVQTQAVTYISQRFASLATMFYLLCVCAYIKGRLARGWWKGGWFALALVSVSLGMLTKQIVLTLPFTILIIEWMFLRQNPVSFKRWLKTQWIGIIVILLPIMIIPWVYHFGVGSMLAMVAPSGSHRGDFITSANYLLTQFSVIVTYIKLLFAPLGQNLLYDYRVSSGILEPRTLASLLFLIAVGIAARVLYAKDRLLSFGIIWFFLALLVESSIIPIAHVIFEHRVYLPSVGFALFLVIGLAHLVKDRRRLVAIYIVLVLTFSWLTFMRNKVWSNDYTLWADVIKKSPEKSRPYMNLGIAYLMDRDYPKAIEYFNLALSKNRLNDRAYNNRGTAYAIIGDLDKAMADFNLALSINPYFADVLVNRGNVVSQKGDIDASIRDYTKAIELKSDAIQAYINRGNKYLQKREFYSALLDYNIAVNYNSTDARLFNNRAKVHLALNKLRYALEDSQEAIRLDPGFDNAYFVRANVYYQLGQYYLALSDLNRIIDMKKETSSTYFFRSAVYKALKNYSQAYKDVLVAQQMGVKIGKEYIQELIDLQNQAKHETGT